MEHDSRTVTVFDAALRLCEISDWTVTDLEMQKILYFIQMVYMGKHGRRFMDTDFEAWDYGPVSSELYRRVSIFGADPIEHIFHGESPLQELDSEKNDFFENGARQLLERTPSELVAMSHWEGGAWARNYRPGHLSLNIPDGDIMDEYRKRKEADEQSRAERHATA